MKFADVFKNFLVCYFLFELVTSFNFAPKKANVIAEKFSFE